MKMQRFDSPTEFLAALDGWRLRTVKALRAVVREHDAFHEEIRWGNLVYSLRGPVVAIRAEEHRVLFVFWRGQLLREIEPRLKPGGKYEMATLDLREGMSIGTAVARDLVRAAIGLDQSIAEAMQARPKPAKKAAKKPAKKPAKRPAQTPASQPTRARRRPQS